KLEAISADGPFEADPIDGCDVTSVGDGVTALDKFPGIVLIHAVLRFFLGMPSDGGGIKQNIGSLQGGQARGFGIPLVPADQHANLAVTGPPGPEPQVARSEVELLVEQRII